MATHAPMLPVPVCAASGPSVLSVLTGVKALQVCLSPATYETISPDTRKELGLALSRLIRDNPA